MPHYFTGKALGASSASSWGRTGIFDDTMPFLRLLGNSANRGEAGLVRRRARASGMVTGTIERPQCASLL